MVTEGPAASLREASTPHNIDYAVGGRLQRFAKSWESASSWVRKVVKDGYRWKFLSKRPPRMRRLPKTKPTDPQVSALLSEYKQKGAIERCPNPLWISSIRSIPKSSGGHRLIVNLRSLNKQIKKRCYRLPTIRNLRLALNQGDWMAKIDIEDAYFHALVHPSLRPYLAFQWHGTFWQFRVLPFGLTTAPAVFTG